MHRCLAELFLLLELLHNGSEPTQRSLQIMQSFVRPNPGKRVNKYVTHIFLLAFAKCLLVVYRGNQGKTEDIVETNQDELAGHPS